MILYSYMKQKKYIRNASKKQVLPPSFQPMFWSYRFSELDRKDDVTLIIKQLLSYGNLRHWQWLIKNYGLRKIRSVLSKTPQSELRPSLVELSMAVFTVESMPHVRRVPHKKR